LPREGLAPVQVIDELVAATEGGHLGSAGGRFFAWVIGGAVSSALAADWLTSTWDQNAGLAACGPAAAVVEEVAGRWLLELLGLPASASFAFTTGCQLAHFTCLAAARHEVLRARGWDVNRDGLFGAPAIQVLVSDARHSSVDRALRFLGVGQRSLRLVPTLADGAIDAAAFRAALAACGAAPTIVALDAADLNIGACDGFAELIPAAQRAGAWVHVDGAFGLIALASEAKRGLLKGVELADSWATDAHKWLNVPYDSGLAFVRNPHALRAAMAITAEYLPTESDQRNPGDFTPELSRRARGVEVWAALRSLGREGLAELIERNCAQARRFAEGLSAAGFEILNEVVLNQVLVSFGSAEETQRVIEAIQADGTCWAGITGWQSRTAMRISVSSWATTDADVERSLDAIIRVAKGR
jgi:aromatic-L-amino-acid decarboxylase